MESSEKTQAQKLREVATLRFLAARRVVTLRVRERLEHEALRALIEATRVEMRGGDVTLRDVTLRDVA